MLPTPETHKEQQMDWSHLTLCILNANLSYTATILNTVAIYAIMKSSSLSRNFKILLLSLAVSDLGVGLLAQPLFVVLLAMDATQKNKTNETYDVMYTVTLIPMNFFLCASLFSVTALCADRFLAIRLHLRYQSLVTYKRLGTTVISIWVISALISVIRLFIPKNIMYVIFVVFTSACIINVTSLSVKLYLTLRRHINQIQVQQLAQTGLGEIVQGKRKSAMASLFVYLVFIVCYLPNICTLFVIAAISEPRIDVEHLWFYTITLSFLNSTLNPLIYCWKMKQIRTTMMRKLRDVFSSHTKRNLRDD